LAKGEENTFLQMGGSNVPEWVVSPTIGDGDQEDVQINYDGNAVDFHMGIDDSADDFIIGTGTTMGSNPAITIDGSTRNVTIATDLTIGGDDLFMATNTSGHVLVADGTNYNPVAISGDVTIASNGAVTIGSGVVEHGMLADDIISGQAEITSGLASADELMYSDGGVVKRIGVDVLATKMLGLASAGAVAQASDHMVFLDGGATGDVIVESIDDFLTAIAGSGISVSSSQLTASGSSGISDGKAIAYALIFGN